MNTCLFLALVRLSICSFQATDMRFLSSQINPLASWATARHSGGAALMVTNLCRNGDVPARRLTHCSRRTDFG